MQIRGVDFAMYPVTDLARAARFYRDVLGLRQEIYSEEWHWAEFDCGNVTLSLKGASERTETGRSARLALAVDDVEAAARAVRQAGVRIVGGPTDHGVCRSLEILDPDGNLLILHQRADGTFGREAAPGR